MELKRNVCGKRNNEKKVCDSFENKIKKQKNISRAMKMKKEKYVKERVREVVEMK